MRRSKHRALTRYRNGGIHRGKQIPYPEIMRRCAQSIGIRGVLPTGHTGRKSSKETITV